MAGEGALERASRAASDFQRQNHRVPEPHCPTPVCDGGNALDVCCPVWWPLATCGCQALKCGYVTEEMHFIFNVNVNS